MREQAADTWPEARGAYLGTDEVAAARSATGALPAWTLDARQRCELELLLSGALTPLTGYLDAADHDSVLERGALTSGQPWPWPLRLEVSEPFAAERSAGDLVALRDAEGLLVARLEVSALWRHGDAPCLAGTVTGIEPPTHYDFRHLRSDPVALRLRMATPGRWLAVMTGRTIGPGEHARIMKHARETDSNILILMETGLPEPGDIHWYARVRALERCRARFPEDSSEMALVPLPPSAGSAADAGLRHVVARNHGASHLLWLDADPAATPELLALDHALGLTDLPATPLRYDADRGRYLDVDTGPGPGAQATVPCCAAELERRLLAGEPVPDWLGWPEQVEELSRALEPRGRQGFTLLLTGLSGSGKSTIARVLLDRLMELGQRRVTLLDGDLVRTHLSRELGFSREDRDTNVLRIGFVASEITHHGGIAICAPIAPYAATRARVREMVEARGGYVEVHVATPLEVCEARDRKGLYARARAGEIPAFTGVSDPYEVPQAPALRVDTTDISPEEAARQVMLRLADLGYL